MRFKPKKNGVKSLLKDRGVGRAVKGKADDIAETANSDATKKGAEFMASDLREGKNRYRATVFAANYLAQHGQHYHDDLTKALDKHKEA